MMVKVVIAKKALEEIVLRDLCGFLLSFYVVNHVEITLYYIANSFIESLE